MTIQYTSADWEAMSVTFEADNGTNETVHTGQTFTHQEMYQTFKVGAMGGIRSSKVYPHIVIISDPTKGFYQDKVIDDVIYYTGTGKLGDQVIEGSHNKFW